MEGLFTPEEGEKISALACNLLHNIDKHSEASLARVKIEQIGGQQLKMEISDNGKGFDPGKTSGIGLDSSRSYVKDLNGEMRIRSKLGEGTSISITIPIS